MAIETPVDVLRRLREESRQRRVASAKAPAQAFRKARTGRERATAFGGQIGAALAKAFGGEEDFEQDPKVIQARKRAKLLSIDQTDVPSLRKGIQIATEDQDYEVANYLLKSMRDQQRLDLQREALESREKIASDKPKKGYKYERYDTDFRKQTMAQLDTDSEITNLEDSHMEVAKPAIVLASEGIYNKNREGGGKMTRPQATAIALEQAKKGFIIDDWGQNSFDQEGYRQHMIAIMGEPVTATLKSINTQEEFDALPSGANYIDAADGKTYTKP